MKSVEIAETISKLTIEEKLTLLTGKNPWSTVAVDRLGIPSIYVADGPHGVKALQTMPEFGQPVPEQRKATCFPTSSALSATFNKDLAYEVGKALAKECHEKEVDMLLAPGVNIKRTPLCGRNFEYFSEDPYLTGILATAYINGIQSLGIGTSIKHFAANNIEFDRFFNSSEVDERTLREIYLKAFEMAITSAQPTSVMCSYNRINGVLSSENRYLLNDILRKEWGFKGFVVSDWGAVKNRSYALKASLELAMHYEKHHYENLKVAYDNNQISDEEIDKALLSLFNVIYSIKENKQKYADELKDFDYTQNRELAKKVAIEAITLLKNEDEILPICKKNVKKILVVGSHAVTCNMQGGGSSDVHNFDKGDTPLDAIKKIAGDIEITYCQAIEWGTYVKGLAPALEIADQYDLVLLFVGNNGEGEGTDRTTIKLSPNMEAIIKNISKVNKNTVAIVQAGGAIDMSAWISDVKSVVFTWLGGQEMGSAIAEILFGIENPSGKLAETFPLCLEDAVYSEHGNGMTTTYNEGVLVGYRYYDYFSKNVLFPFGYGLSYTKFEYSNLKITPIDTTENAKFEIEFTVKNIGNVAGKETAQLYVSDTVSFVTRPVKELKAFEKVELMPSEQKTVKFTLNSDAFAYYNIMLKKWHIESGSFKILVGSSSRDIHLEEKLNITTTY